MLMGRPGGRTVRQVVTLQIVKKEVRPAAQVTVSLIQSGTPAQGVTSG